MFGAKIGARCIFGQNTMVATDVIVGNNVKVQNNVSIYTGTVIEDDVFLGPSCVLTNVTNPRSQVNRHKLYERTLIRRGATIGANATIVCGITLGRYCFISAGAVVTNDVPDYALIIGVPGRQKGWMSRHGHVLKLDTDGLMRCPESGYRYRLEPISGSESQPVKPTHRPTDALSAVVSAKVEASHRLCCLDLDEESPLPSELAIGSRVYDEFKPR